MRRMITAGLAVTALALAGCGPASSASGQHAAGTQAPAARAAQAAAAAARQHRPPGPPGTQATGVLRLGLATAITDAPALVGWQMGYFGRSLGKATLQPLTFPTSAAELTALQDGQLDAAYLDPVAALQAWQAAPGALKIVAGATSGGAELVVATGITSPAQLKGRRLATTAGTQQAAADHWLGQHGLPALTTAETAASTPAAILAEFKAGKIAGAWEPPPLDIQMASAGGRILVNENNLWTGGQYPTAVLAVTTSYLTAHPTTITALLNGQIQASQFLTHSPVSAAAAIAQRLAAYGTPLPTTTIAKSLTQLTFTENPLPASLKTQAADATTAGLIKPPTNLTSIYDLTLLNQIRKTTGQPPINS